MLGVREATLAAHGAVSEATAREMVERRPRPLRLRSRRGGHRHRRARAAAAPDKPVGLVHLAAGRAAATDPPRRAGCSPGDRAAVRLATVEAALQLALEVVR